MSAPPPLPKYVPNWRRLDWWLGNTPEQIEEVNQEARELQGAPVWVKGCLSLFIIVVVAVLVAVKGVLILIPTAGLILILGIHYLITGKVLAPPIPIWFHLAFWMLLLLTVFLAAAD
jgi:hypothetical protein